MTSYLDGRYHEPIIAYEFSNGNYLGLITDRGYYQGKTVHICFGTSPYSAIDTLIPYKQPHMAIASFTFILLAATLMFLLFRNMWSKKESKELVVEDLKE